MNDVDLDLLIGQLDQRIFQGFHGAVDIRLNNQIEVLDLAFLHLLEKVLEAHAVRFGKFLGSLLLGAMQADLFGILFVLQGDQFIAGDRHARKSKDFHRN